MGSLHVIVSKLIYYNAIYKIESKKPNEKKSAKKYIHTELKKLKRFFDNNLEFYKYYRTNNAFIDDQLFVRGKYDIKLNLDTIYVCADPPLRDFEQQLETRETPGSAIRFKDQDPGGNTQNAAQ